MNPWLRIPLADYEGHMALPYVGQAQLLAEILGAALDKHKPGSIALLGCAGGNGLEEVASRHIERVVAIDINPSYIEETRTRWSNCLTRLTLLVGDVQTENVVFAPVDMVYAALLFEYVDVPRTLANIRPMLCEHGVLVTVTQLPSASTFAITPSPFSSLSSLSSIMNLVPPKRLIKLAEESGYRQTEEYIRDAKHGKQLSVQSFQLACDKTKTTVQ